MAKRKSAAAYQYAPLVTPEAWQEDERRFAVRIRQILDSLHAAQAALEKRVQALEEEKSAQV